jgi:putative thioredoxin
MTDAPISSASVRGAVDLSALVNQHDATESASSLVMTATDATFSRILDLSKTVPVVVEFHAPGIAPALRAVVEQYGGRIVLATVDGTTNPQLAQAFQVSEVPAVAAVIGGRPIQLFVGIPPEDELRLVLEQVLKLAAEQGVTGSVAATDPAEELPAAEEPLPPHHQEAYDAIAAGDYPGAIAEYQKAIAQNPRDALAVAGLAQVSLLLRLEGVDPAIVKAAAATDVPAQLSAADVEISNGAFEAGFDRLLTLFPTCDADDKNLVRARLLEYFEIVGVDDPIVNAARRRLTGLLY